ncbi:hypothetical protein PHYSODRAFT_340929 [Phytophthora sojae]|uniref:Uncharacterized protein n=1 Tax=Phytophthora sojae (strain P6497) TaxID=1094619 RepID=G5ABJ3_PHYSP|nr:hypothetical protein PHYSODRAFT_340929 [Phytophthora sojae]EGZ06718.1 hypothetical protein PHYSODRAFT_340929 [Phytophthora sojae]|eukprot:XP_009537482.1 hypothetical protein PHYSODRAFT_340929 [Phytophthora sojae]
MVATPRRSPRQPILTRVSPYPLRSRTPTPGSSPSTSQPTVAPRASPSQTDVSGQGTRPLQATPAVLRPQQLPATRAPAAPATASPARSVGLLAAPPAAPATSRVVTSLPRPESMHEATTEADQAAPSHLYQLLLRPIVKATIAQRDTSAETLDDVVVNGGSFDEILQKIWSLFSGRVKCRAVLTDGEWFVETHEVDEWDRVMQFRAKKKVVESTKSAQAWKQWLQKMRGHTVTLVIYEYGLSIARAQDRDEFVAACIQPEETDREGVVWRLWANYLTRNLNRSTWDAAIQQPPPEYIANLLRLVDTQMEQHVAEVTRTANVALDVVEATIADYRQLRQRWEFLGQYLDENERGLEVRKSVIMGFLRDITPPACDEVIDPLLQMENVEDTEHAE